MIAIIDYDAGNLKSVEKAVAYLGEEAEITRDPQKIFKAQGVILPGVGSFGDAMTNLRRYQLPEVIRSAAKRQIPLLGICLGLQLLFEESEESPVFRDLESAEGKFSEFPMALILKYRIWDGIH